MAKKPRRKSSKAANEMAQTASNGRNTEQGFNPDYSYVIKDLRRIGILAGSFFAILITLSFFLR